MHQIKYKIKTKAPILISSSSSNSNMVSALDYISGTVLSGIFAWKYIEKMKLDFNNAHEDDFFYRCFLNPGLCFSNAYTSKESDYGTEYFYPVPFSIQNEKNNDKKLFDLLVNDIDEQTKIIEGYCLIKGDQFKKIKPETALNFHHSRNRERLKGIREKLIFNYESLNAGQEFSGRITGEKNDLENFIKNFNNPVKINIGRSKNIQYGGAVIEFISAKPEEIFSEIEPLDQEIGSEFILTLLSPAIIFNENGFSVMSISDLKKHIAESACISEDIEIRKSFIKTNIVENFVSKWLLKKPSETAFAAGSCFMIRINNLDTETKNKLLELQRKGIGERRNEGFGRFVLNWQNPAIEKYNILDYKEEKPAQPKGYPPALINNIVKKVVEYQYQKQTQEKALEDCREFCKNKARIPSNSVLGRLEMIITNLEDSKKFSSIVKNDLRETARDKLRRCRNEKTDLFDFITENNPDIEQTIINQNLDLIKVSSLTKYDPNVLKSELYKLYWITFLRLMRKENRRGE